MISNSLEYHSNFIRRYEYKVKPSNYNEGINKALNEEKEKQKLIQYENFKDDHISRITENLKYSEDFVDSFLNNNESKYNSFSFYE